VATTKRPPAQTKTTKKKAAPGKRWSPKSPLSWNRAVLVAAVVVLVGGGLLLYKAFAYTYRCGAATATWGTASCNHFGNSFTGSMVDKKTDGYCVEIKRKTSSGGWTTSGVAGNSACQLNVYKDWSISSSYPVYGIRLYNGNGYYTTLCSTYTLCHATL
jgi:hypothetical protein